MRLFYFYKVKKAFFASKKHYFHPEKYFSVIGLLLIRNFFVISYAICI